MTDPLAQASYDSLDAMMQAYSAEAVRVAAREHKAKLDYSTDSIEALEGILQAIYPVPEADVERLTKLWGGYYGEVFRRRYSAGWSMSLYPGAQFAVPTIEVSGSRIYPLLKVQRRLTMGDGEDLVKFTQMARQRLDLLHPPAN